MATTLTREQRLSLIEAYETEGNNAWDVADEFKRMRPKTYNRALSRVCRSYGIRTSDVENENSQAWIEVEDTALFWHCLACEIFEKCEIIYTSGGYMLKEEFENA